MTNHFRTHIAVLSFSLWCVTPAVQAAKPDADEAERANVQQVLRSETTAGANVVNRREVLSPTQRPKTESKPMWWQSGYVKIDGEWRSIEQSTVASGDAGLMAEYRERRKATPKMADGQFALANWCRNHKLLDQERAHLMQTLLLAEPNRDVTTTHERLNHKRIGEQWIASSELAELEQRAKSRAKAMELWIPKAERIARNLEGNEKHRQLAKKELEEIDDPQAIPALTSTLAFGSETSAKCLVDVLTRIPEYEGAQGLANMALFAQWGSVRSAATASLASRSLDDYVPEVMGLLHRPPSVNQRNRPRGLELVILLEGHESVRAAHLDLASPEIVRVIRQTGPDLGRRTRMQYNHQGVETYFSWLHRIDEMKDAVDFINARGGHVLAAVTGEEANSDPEYWWNWWAQVNGNDQPSDKPVNVVVTERAVGDLRETTIIRRSSCLVASTPIWTDRGFISVEKIAAGDCVLAKNIETGELAYKPVVHTTVRRPVPVTKFVVSGQPIVASSGHNFWVSGSGWTKTRELIPQQPIHTVIGMARVESVEDEAEPAPVYNLVVADFHTYFVGPAMILSHDVLPPRPTNVKVPGLTPK